MWTWIILFVCLFALAFRRKLRLAFEWHPVILFANVAVLATGAGVAIGAIFMMAWLRDQIGAYPASGVAFGAVGAFFVIYRLATGRWPW